MEYCADIPQFSHSCFGGHLGNLVFLSTMYNPVADILICFVLSCFHVWLRLLVHRGLTTSTLYLPSCFLKWLYEFTLPPAVYENSLLAFTSLSLLDSFRICFCQFGRCEIESHDLTPVLKVWICEWFKVMFSVVLYVIAEYLHIILMSNGQGNMLNIQLCFLTEITLLSLHLY